MDNDSLITAIAILTLLATVMAWLEARRRRRRRHERTVENTAETLDTLQAEIYPVVHERRFLNAEDMARIRATGVKARIAIQEQALCDCKVLSKPARVAAELEALLAVPYPPDGTVSHEELGQQAVKQVEAGQKLMEAIGRLRREIDDFRRGE